jgi:hypothetical protein
MADIEIRNLTLSKELEFEEKEKDKEKAEDFEKEDWEENEKEGEEKKEFEEEPSSENESASDSESIHQYLIKTGEKRKEVVKMKNGKGISEISELIIGDNLFDTKDVVVFGKEGIEADKSAKIKNIYLSGKKRKRIIRVDIKGERKISVSGFNEQLMNISVSSHTLISSVKSIYSKTFGIMSETLDVYFGEKEICEERTIDEMEISEGNMMTMKSNMIGRIFDGKSICDETIVKSILDYIENMKLEKVKKIITKEFLNEVKKLTESEKDNQKTLFSLFSIISSLAYRVSLNTAFFPEFYVNVKESGVEKIFEEEAKRMVSEKDKENMRNEESDVVIGYALMMYKKSPVF